MPDTYCLANLLAPFSAQEFVETIRRDRPLHVPGTPDKFAFAMSWDLLNQILDQSDIWTPRSFQLVLDGQKVPADSYGCIGMGRDGNPAQLVDFDKARDLIRRGATVLLTDIGTLTSGVKSIGDMLSRELGGKVEGNLYCSWEAHQAFPIHFDVSDVFVIQIAGEKKWRIYDRAVRDPIRHPKFLNQELLRKDVGKMVAELVMRPGDFLYIPGGFSHEALAQSDATLHVTFAHFPMTGRDVIPMLYDLGAADELLRAPLPNPSLNGGQALDEHLARLGLQLGEMLRDPAVRAAVDSAIRNYHVRAETLKLPDDAGKG